jgi:hypothetical protein
MAHDMKIEEVMVLVEEVGDCSNGAVGWAYIDICYMNCRALMTPFDDCYNSFLKKINKFTKILSETKLLISSEHW